MKTPASIVVNKITEDRLLDFIAQFRDKTFHDINKYIFHNYKVSLTNETLGKIYSVHRKQHTYKPTLSLRRLRKKDYWKEIEELFKSQVQEDVADFIYEHFKKSQK